MRKDALKRLLFNYQKDFEERKEVPDNHVVYLKEFLETEEEILLLNEDENVPIAKFVTFVAKNHSKENKLAEIFAQGHSIDANVKVTLIHPDDKMVSTFVKPTYVLLKKENSYALAYYEQGKKIKDIPLEGVPGLSEEIQKTSRDKSISNKIKAYHLNFPKIRRAKFFKTFLEHEPLDWKEKLLETNCNKKLLQDLINLNLISHYEILYKTLVRLGRDKQKLIVSTWELICLSGDILAVRHVIDKPLIDAKSENAWKATPWDLANLSQSADTPRMIADKFPHMKKTVDEKQKPSSDTAASVQQTIASSSIIMDSKDEKTPIKRSKTTFASIMEPNIFSHIRKFFDTQSAAQVTVNRFLDSNIKRGNAYWQEQLIKMSFDETLLATIVQLDVIKNYKNLYDVFNHLKKHQWSVSNFNNIWEWFCLSKEPRAVKYAIDKILINENKKNNYEFINYALLVFLSGSVDGVRLIMRNPDIDLRAKIWGGWNALLFAFGSGSLEMTKLAMAIPNMDLCAKTLVGYNAVLLAFSSGSLEMVKLAMTIPNMDLYAKTSRGFNAVLIAFSSGSLEKAKLAMTIPNIDLQAKTSDGWNVVFLAFDFDLEMVKLALSIKNIDLLATVKCTFPIVATQVNVLHVAAFRGAVDAIILLRQELHKRNLRLVPEAKDSKGHDSFWYAEQSGKNVGLIKAALVCPVDKLNTFFTDFENQQKKPAAASDAKDPKADSVRSVRK